jgi:hypothetical protein
MAYRQPIDGKWLAAALAHISALVPTPLHVLVRVVCGLRFLEVSGHLYLCVLGLRGLCSLGAHAPSVGFINNVYVCMCVHNAYVCMCERMRGSKHACELHTCVYGQASRMSVYDPSLASAMLVTHG